MRCIPVIVAGVLEGHELFCVVWVAAAYFACFEGAITMSMEFALMCESPWLIELLWRAEAVREFMSLASDLVPLGIAMP